MKTFNKIKNGCRLLVTCLGLAVSFNANAGLMVQTDTNGLAALSTNTFKIYGDVTGSYTNGELSASAQFIDGSKAADLYCSVGGFFTNSGAGSSNIVFKISQSVDLVNWTNAATSVTLAVPVGTNWVNAQFKLSGAYPGYGLRSVENPNTGNVSAAPNTVYFKAYGKNGI